MSRNDGDPANHIGRRVATGALWLGIGHVVASIANVGGLLGLAALLTPSEFGLAAIALFVSNAVIIGLSFGLNQLIQTVDNSLQRDVIGFSLLLGGLSAIAMVMTAPLTAQLLGNNEAAPLIIVLAPAVILRRWSETSIGLIERHLQFSIGATYRAAGAIIGSLVAVGSALFGAGPWAMVVQFITLELVTAVGVAIAKISFLVPRLSSSSLRRILQLGREFLGNSIIIFAYNNLDDAFVSRSLGTAALGAYNFAYRLANLPTSLFTRVANRTLLPTLRQLTDEGRGWQGAYSTAVRLLSWSTSLISFGILLHGPATLDVIYGDRWSSGYNALRILAVYGLFRAVAATSGSVFIASRRPALIRKIAQWQTLAMISILIPAIGLWETSGAAIAVTVPLGVAASYAIYRTCDIVSLQHKTIARIIGSAWSGTFLANLVAVPVRRLFEGWTGLIAGGLTVALIALLHAMWTIRSDVIALRDQLRPYTGD